MTVYGAQVDRKWAGSEPEENQNWNARDLKVQGALGCPENAKSSKSHAPQGFSGCLDIDNDEMNKKNFYKDMVVFQRKSRRIYLDG